MNYPDFLNCNVAVIGLGYVGLPLAVEFCKHQKCKITKKQIKRKVIAYDVNPSRIKSLKNYEDINDQIDTNQLRQLNSISK